MLDMPEGPQRTSETPVANSSFNNSIYMIFLMSTRVRKLKEASPYV